MDMEITLLTIVFTGIFAALGLVYRVISSFKKDMIGNFLRLEKFFINHIHAEDGTAYVPRKHAPN